jgi:septation ring formation regulator EzrA
MRLDIKSIALLVLSSACILFFGMWFFKGSDYKDKIKALEIENKKIESVRDSLKLANASLKLDFDKKQSEISKRDQKIKLIEFEIEKAKKDLKVATAQVEADKRSLKETKDKIEKLKKDPIKREGDELLNSLKEKLNH